MRGYNTESVAGIYLERASYNQLKDAGPGAFTYHYDLETQLPSRLVHRLPGAGYGSCPIMRDKDDPTGPCWRWDGNVEKPTLSPSIHAHPVATVPATKYPGRPGWHGHLVAGRFESC